MGLPVAFKRTRFVIKARKGARPVLAATIIRGHDARVGSLNLDLRMCAKSLPPSGALEGPVRWYVRP